MYALSFDSKGGWSLAECDSCLLITKIHNKILASFVLAMTKIISSQNLLEPPQIICLAVKLWRIFESFCILLLTSTSIQTETDVKIFAMFVCTTLAHIHTHPHTHCWFTCSIFLCWFLAVFFLSNFIYICVDASMFVYECGLHGYMCDFPYLKWLFCELFWIFGALKNLLKYLEYF